MIQNEHQYTVTQSKLQELEQGLAELDRPDLNLHPRQMLARRNSFNALIAKLQQEIDEYNRQKPAPDWRDRPDIFCQSPADQRLWELLQNLFTTSEIRQHQTRQRLYRVLDNTALLGHVKDLAQIDPCAAAILDDFWPWLFQNDHATFRPEPSLGLCQSFINYLHDHLEQQLGYLDYPKKTPHFANRVA
jgi:hypothetical protein